MFSKLKHPQTLTMRGLDNRYTFKYDNSGKLNHNRVKI